jgi:hypothetical protein
VRRVLRIIRRGCHECNARSAFASGSDPSGQFATGQDHLADAGIGTGISDAGFSRLAATDLAAGSRHHAPLPHGSVLAQQRLVRIAADHALSTRHLGRKRLVPPLIGDGRGAAAPLWERLRFDRQRRTISGLSIVGLSGHWR